MSDKLSSVAASRSNRRSDLFVSVVAPVRNATAYLQQFLDELIAVLDPAFTDYEIVLVDDCSRDGTVDLVEKLQRRYRNLQLYALARRVGADSAFVIGIEHAIGDVVVTMDPAYDPADRIPDLIASYYQGHEIVYGLRGDRTFRARKGLYQRVARAFFAFYRKITGEDIPPDLSSFRLLTRRVVNTFVENRDKYNLFPVIAAFTGIPYTTLRYDRLERPGASRDIDYLDSVGRAIGLLLLSSKRPLRLMTAGSIVGALLSVVYAVYVFLVHFLTNSNLAPGWTSLSLQIAGLFFVQFIILAVMSEYLIRVFVHSQNRPPYIVNRESSSLVLARKAELNVTGRPESENSDTGGPC